MTRHTNWEGHNTDDAKKLLVLIANTFNEYLHDVVVCNVTPEERLTKASRIAYKLSKLVDNALNKASEDGYEMGWEDYDDYVMGRL
jgi:hypothetical protein